MENEIVVAGASDMFMPVMNLGQAKARRGALVEFVKDLMTLDHDFGKVPGTDKPTLLKPGAEKLVTFFGLAPVFVPERVTENFGDDGSEPLFFYRYRCELYRNGVMVGTGIGSCNSRESKYRYRNSNRKCPSCGKECIIKGKQEYGGGWLCFKNKGGCGAKFKDGDASIEQQETGKVKNLDIADIVNTIDKMAQKRALIAATLIAVNASEFFTQDVEDMPQYVDSTVTVVTGGAAHNNGTVASAGKISDAGGAERSEKSAGTGNGNSKKMYVGLANQGTLNLMHALGTQAYGKTWDEERHRIIGQYTKGRTSSSKEITQAEADWLVSKLQAKIDAESPEPESEPDEMEIVKMDEMEIVGVLEVMA